MKEKKQTHQSFKICLQPGLGAQKVENHYSKDLKDFNLNIANHYCIFEFPIKVIQKEVNCKALFSNPDIDRASEFQYPPTKIPKYL